MSLTTMWIPRTPENFERQGSRSEVPVHGRDRRDRFRNILVNLKRYDLCFILFQSHTMKTRMQFCPVCEQQTPHTYQPASPLLAIVLLCCFLVPGLLYIVYAMRRADRTATCTVDHAALQRARGMERVRTISEVLACMQRERYEHELDVNDHARDVDRHVAH